ncbi:MAG TPA: hypothetical protein DHV90_02920 [Lactobacillus sp.]|nr:hypothetical protein [Ligilactobacillus ruminis]HCI89702.1 hypothetical protein [Lactobacillus sp.]
MSSTVFKKYRTKAVANRPPSFGISFISRGKRDFFPSLFFISYNRSDLQAKAHIHPFESHDSPTTR